MCQQIRDQLASKEQELKRKDKEMMQLRGKVLDSREEYFSNLQRLDATLTTTSTKKVLGTKRVDQDDLLALITLRRKSCDDNKSSPLKKKKVVQDDHKERKPTSVKEGVDQEV